MRFLPVLFAGACFMAAASRAANPPAAAPPGSAASAKSQPDMPAHLRELTKKMPESFSCRVETPFVVVGNLDAKTLEAFSRQTIRWAVDNLKKEYFAKDPDAIIDIWLFKDDASYRKYTKSIFGDEPDTPFGYYSETHRALIMNISTGGGTLVHEIVHPFIHANFPSCPSWFNEGLASLYEQCGERDGRIAGYTNWRLPILQKAIAAGTLPSFQKLTAMTSQEFYNGPYNANYPQSRYLCYYLQEKGLLGKFYQQFAGGASKDPTGFETLKAVLGVRDMDRFQKDWEKWILTLTFP